MLSLNVLKFSFRAVTQCLRAKIVLVSISPRGWNAADPRREVLAEAPSKRCLWFGCLLEHFGEQIAISEIASDCRSKVHFLMH